MSGFCWGGNKKNQVVSESFTLTDTFITDGSTECSVVHTQNYFGSILKKNKSKAKRFYIRILYIRYTAILSFADITTVFLHSSSVHTNKCDIIKMSLE